MRSVTSNRLRNASKRLMLLILAILLVILCVYVFVAKPFGEDKVVDVFTLVGTLLGTVFIAVELQNTQVVTCCEMLVNLNNYFHENDKLMSVYGHLERHYLSEFADRRLETDVDESDIAAYCTFFENLYLLVNNRIARISDIDDLFGYRFFIFVNNPWIQEKCILPTSSSYRQIFALYDIWIDYRRKSRGLNHIPLEKYAFSDAYLDKQLYLMDKEPSTCAIATVATRDGSSLTLRELGFKHLSDILRLQEQVHDAMPQKDMLAPLTREELIESLHLDRLIGAFTAESEPVAFVLMVANRRGERNLAKDAGKNWRHCLTLDMVMVHPLYRGNGLQKVLVENITRLSAATSGAECVLATVAPDNAHSLGNFRTMGYEVAVENVAKYGGLTRSILCLNLKSS